MPPRTRRKPQRVTEAQRLAAAQQELMRHRQSVEQAAWAEVDAVLRKHNCILLPRIVIVGGNIVESSIVVSMQAPQPAPPPRPSNRNGDEQDA